MHFVLFLFHFVQMAVICRHILVVTKVVGFEFGINLSPDKLFAC